MSHQMSRSAAESCHGHDDAWNADADAAPGPLARRAHGARLTVMLLLVALLAAGLIGFQRFKANILKTVVHQITSQVPTVATATATLQQWQPKLDATGTLRASRGADLAAEVPGIVDEIDFASGADVAAGTVLLRLRPNDDVAKLAQLQAAADLAEITYAARPEAARGAGGGAGDGRYRRGEPEQRAGAGRGAAGADGREDRARAVRRPARHPPGRSRPVSRRPARRS